MQIEISCLEWNTWNHSDHDQKWDNWINIDFDIDFH